MEIVEEDVGANEQLKTSDYSSGNSETSSDSCPDQSVEAGRSAADDAVLNKFSRKCADGSKVFVCPHCPFATKLSMRFSVHLVNHLKGPKLILKNPRRSAAAIIAENNKEKQSKCPFCSYTNISNPSLQKHMQMHFNFKHFLKMRRLEVRYERHWANCDTVEVRNTDDDNNMESNT